MDLSAPRRAATRAPRSAPRPASAVAALGAVLAAGAAALAGAPHALPAQARAVPDSVLTVRVHPALPPHTLRLAWRDSFLREIAVWRGGSGGGGAGRPAPRLVQRIPVGESEAVSSDLDASKLPPDYLTPLDYDGDGYQDLVLLVALGTDAQYQVLRFEPGTGRFAAPAAWRYLRTGALERARRRVPFRYAERVGLVEVQPGGAACLVVQTPNVAAGTAAQVVFATRESRVFGAVVGAVRPGGCPPGGSEARAEPEPGDVAYTLHLAGDTAAVGPAVGVAVLAPRRRLAAGPSPTGDVDGDGRPEYVRLCASTEGLHLTVWTLAGPSGAPAPPPAPPRGVRRWHRYHYLGYAVEATCARADTR